MHGSLPAQSVFRVPGFTCKNLCVFGQKFGEGVMGRGQKIGFFLFPRDLAEHAPQQADWALDRL